jgi:hypothetical protein
LSVHRFLGLLVAAALPVVTFLSPYSNGAPLKTSMRSHVGREVKMLEIGSPPKARAARQPSADIKVISYNIRWRNGEDLRQLIKLFQADPEIE